VRLSIDIAFVGTDDVHEEVDISSEEALISLYGIRIPVVKSKALGVEIGWPFTKDDLCSL